MPRAWSECCRVLVTWLLVAGTARISAAQTLNLDGAQLPKLSDDTQARAIVTQLTTEVEQPVLNPPASLRDREPHTALALDAQRWLRVLAALLLERADALGRDGCEVYVAGASLARERDAFDKWTFEHVETIEVSNDGPARLGLLRDFVRSAQDLRDRLRQVSSAAEMDRLLQAIFQPLCRANLLFGSGEMGTAFHLQELRAWNDDESTLEDPTRSAIRVILSYLERGAEFPEFRPQILREREALEILRQCERALNDATWLDDGRRAELIAGIDAFVARFVEKSTRADALAEAVRWRAAGETLNRLNKLAAFRRDRVNVEAIAGTLLEVDASGRAVAESENHARILKALDEMIAFRELPPVELRGPMRVVERKLENLFREGEANLLADLQRLATDDEAVSDPAYLSRLTRQDSLIDDIRRLRRYPVWREAIGGIDRLLVQRFDAQLLGLAGKLLDPAQHDEASRALSQLDDEVRAFMQMPMEDALAKRDAATDALVGGVAVDIVTHLESTRQEWAETWAGTGRPGRASSDLRTLRRALEIVQQCAGDPRLLSLAAQLNRAWWWELDEEIASSQQRDIDTRIRLALRDLLENRVPDTTGQLETLVERDAVGLAVGMLAAFQRRTEATTPPKATPKFLVWCDATSNLRVLPRALSRPTLAAFCRYAAESRYARDTGQDEIADACDAYVASLYERLSKRINSARD